MTTLTHRDLGPDKRAAEMSDSDEAGHDLVDRQRQHAWVPGSTALLTWLIGLSDILAIFRPDLVDKLHKINYLVPGTLTTAYLALKLFAPEVETVVVPFDKIIPSILAGKYDAGLIIHEEK